MKTYKDIYQFPLRKDKYSSWVRDSKEQFVFEFQFYENEDLSSSLLAVINGVATLTKNLTFAHKGGIIFDTVTNRELILIRGWGNLTGIGGHNLPAEEAVNIQDTFAELFLR